MKFRSFFYILTTICIPITLLGCLNGDENGKTEENNEYEYLAKIRTVSEDNYTIIVPIVVNQVDENISSIINDLDILGNGNYKIEHTEYGIGLNISARGNVTIEAKGNNFVEYGILSLKFDSDGDGITRDEGPDVEYWYYFTSKSNMSVNLEIKCRIKHGPSSYKSELFLTNISKMGWNRKDGRESITLP